MPIFLLVVCWLGSVLGSSILLASQSYLDIYQESNAAHKGQNSTYFDPVSEEDEEGDIFDNSEYVDTLEGRLPLAEAARMIARDSSRHGSLFAASHIRAVRNDCYKRLCTIGISFILLFSSSFGVRTTSNSLGEDKRLLLVCYGSLYSLMWFGGVCANPIMRRVRPKWAMVLAITGFILYPSSMFYTSYYTTLPATMFAGFCIGLLWSVEAVYLMNTASTYSLVSGEPLAMVVRKFNGVVFSFHMSSPIFGNLLSSLLLSNLYTLPGEVVPSMSINRQNVSLSSINTTMTASVVDFSQFNHTMNNSEHDIFSCGLNYKPNSEALTDIPQIYIGKQYIYFGVNTLLPALAGCNVILFLRKLKVSFNLFLS